MLILQIFAFFLAHFLEKSYICTIIYEKRGFTTLSNHIIL